MDIRINKDSEISVLQQLGNQIAFLVATGRWEAGKQLPSVRDLSRRLGIHHNTVSQAYRRLADHKWLVGQRGKRMRVNPKPTFNYPLKGRSPHPRDLDHLINSTLRAALERGFTLQQLRQRVWERLRVEPPNSILVVDWEPGLCRLIREELKEDFAVRIRTCSPSDLKTKAGLASGALVTCPVRTMEQVTPLLPSDQVPIPITYSMADKHLERVRKLKQPSIIALVSVSRDVLEVSQGLFAPFIGERHTVSEHIFPLKGPHDLDAADLIFCDSIAYHQLKVSNLVHYRLVSPPSLKAISEAIQPANSRLE